MAVNNENKYVAVLLKNGEWFAVQGETVDDVCTMPVTHHSGWACFTLRNGKTAQVRAEEIAAIYECEDSDK